MKIVIDLTQLNIFAWIYLGLSLFALIGHPLIWGKPRRPGKYGGTTLFFGILELIFFLLAVSR